MEGQTKVLQNPNAEMYCMVTYSAAAYKSSSHTALLCCVLMCWQNCFHRVLLVEVFACSRQARQLFIQDVFFGAHTVIFHVLCPVELTNIKIEYLQKEWKSQEFLSLSFETFELSCFQWLIRVVLLNRRLLLIILFKTKNGHSLGGECSCCWHRFYQNWSIFHWK